MIKMERNLYNAFVKVQEGWLKGKVQGKIKIFKGIPYAKAPVGKLRWQPPVPMESWSHVHSALHFGPEPVQAIDYDARTECYGIASGNVYSEDCLYLNVYTPADTSNEKLAVFFWIHGGGFCSGASSQTLYPGEKLAEQAHMIVVTVNYRLGIFGFFQEKDQGKSGNYGFMDQNLALKWVRENISVFGGDQNKICIAGQSAGSLSVGALLFSKGAKGLFQRAILESGPILGRNLPFRQREEAVKDTEEFMRAAGVSSIEVLRDFDAWKVFGLAEKFQQEKGRLCFWPCIDGVILEKQPLELIQEKKFHRVDLLCGATSEEFAGGGQIISKADFGKYLEEIFEEKARMVSEAYPCDSDSEACRAFAGLYDDSMEKECLDMAKLMADGRENKAWCYWFTRAIRGEQAIFHCAPHSAELPFLFHRINRGGISPWDVCSWTESDEKFSNQLIDMWAAFVKGEQPAAQWRPYHEGFVMELGEEVMPAGEKLKKRMNIRCVVENKIKTEKVCVHEEEKDEYRKAGSNSLQI